MSFYRTAKPAPSMMRYAIEFELEPEPSSAMRSVLCKARRRRRLFYYMATFMALKGVGGDTKVDTKATSYTFHVRE